MLGWKWNERERDDNEAWDIDEAWVLDEAWDGDYTKDDEEDAIDWDDVGQKWCRGHEYAGTEMMF